MGTSKYNCLVKLLYLDQMKELRKLENMKDKGGKVIPTCLEEVFTYTWNC